MDTVTINRTTVEQALETILVYATKAEHKRTPADNCQAEEAVAALRQALEQPRPAPPELEAAVNDALGLNAQQEPAAWQGTAKPTELVAAEDWENIDPMWHWMYRPLYTHPQVIDKFAVIRIATALGWEPKRDWVGLTDEEVGVVCEQIAADGPHHSIERFVTAIEAKLKGKNT